MFETPRVCSHSESGALVQERQQVLVLRSSEVRLPVGGTEGDECLGSYANRLVLRGVCRELLKSRDRMKTLRPAGAAGAFVVMYYKCYP